ncbi:MAG: hypothetical protein LBT01_04230 [Spirochaetaceae bacterium]|jgi:hypothetical protein|nr:hypothetical protein [Spirochaetaceae bacterium]
MMETTFDKFINNDPDEKKIFEKEYDDFVLSEFALEKMHEENISIRAPAEKMGGVSY